MSPTKITPRSMKGTLELLPRQQVVFQDVIDRIRRSFERYGYSPIATPAIELTDVLLAKTGGETEKQAYFVQSTGQLERGSAPELALRFDLTVPLARYVAQYEGQLTFPLRRSQIQQVYRGERPQQGRYREFFQCDVDVIGKDTLDLRYDAEIASLVIDVFRDLNFGDFTTRISNRKILLAALDELDVAPDKRALVMREVDKIDKRGADAVRETLATGDLALAQVTIDAILALIGVSGDVDSVIAQLRDGPFTSSAFRIGVDELETVTTTLAKLGAPASNYAIDLAIVRGLDYYTGTVFETRLDDYPEIGSICGGGRYDDLAGLYTKSKLPGVGASIGITRLFPKLAEAGLLPDSRSIARVLVTQQDADYFDDYLDIAMRLRSSGIETELLIESWKFKKQMKYANASGIPYVVIMGERERAANTVVVKDMVSGDQFEVSRDELPVAIRERGARTSGDAR